MSSRQQNYIDLRIKFLRPKVEGVATQIWVATHYLRTAMGRWAHPLRISMRRHLEKIIQVFHLFFSANLSYMLSNIL